MVTTIDWINTIFNILLKVSIVVLLSILGFKLYKFYTTKITDIKNKAIENEKIKLYASIDPKLVREELVNLIREYASRYMTKNIMVNQITYIKNDQIDSMVKEIVKDVMLEMSDLYVSYCKLLYTVNSDDDLLKVVYYLTVDVVLDIVTKYNQPE